MAHPERIARGRKARARRSSQPRAPGGRLVFQLRREDTKPREHPKLSTCPYLTCPRSGQP